MLCYALFTMLCYAYYAMLCYAPQCRRYQRCANVKTAAAIAAVKATTTLPLPPRAAICVADSHFYQHFFLLCADVRSRLAAADANANDGSLGMAGGGDACGGIGAYARDAALRRAVKALLLQLVDDDDDAVDGDTDATAAGSVDDADGADVGGDVDDNGDGDGDINGDVDDNSDETAARRRDAITDARWRRCGHRVRQIIAAATAVVNTESATPQSKKSSSSEGGGGGGGGGGGVGGKFAVTFPMHLPGHWAVVALTIYTAAARGGGDRVNVRKSLVFDDSLRRPTARGVLGGGGGGSGGVTRKPDACFTENMRALVEVVAALTSSHAWCDRHRDGERDRDATAATAAAAAAVSDAGGAATTPAAATVTVTTAAPAAASRVVKTNIGSFLKRKMPVTCESETGSGVCDVGGDVDARAVVYDSRRNRSMTTEPTCYERVALPQQRGGGSCGFYALRAVAAFVNGGASFPRRWAWSAADIPAYRLRLLLTLADAIGIVEPAARLTQSSPAAQTSPTVTAASTARATTDEAAAAVATATLSSRRASPPSRDAARARRLRSASGVTTTAAAAAAAAATAASAAATAAAVDAQMFLSAGSQLLPWE